MLQILGNSRSTFTSGAASGTETRAESPIHAGDPAYPSAIEELRAELEMDAETDAGDGRDGMDDEDESRDLESELREKLVGDESDDTRPLTTGSLRNLTADAPESMFVSAHISEVPFDMGEFAMLDEASDPAEAAEAAFLKTVVLKYESELQWVRSKLREERQLHRELKFRIESLHATKNSHIRAIRDGKSKLLHMHERIRTLSHWINHESKLAYERERDRSLALIQKASDLMKRFADRTSKQRKAVELARQKRMDSESGYMQIRSEAADIRIKCYETEETIKANNAEIETLEWEVAEKRKLKNELIEARIRAEAIARENDLKLMSIALEKRRAMGGRAMVFEDLDVVDLSDVGLSKVPKTLFELKRAKHLDLDRNKLHAMEGVQDFPELVSFTANNNSLETITVVQMTHLRYLSLAYNNLKEIKGITDELMYLDLSGNPILNVDSLAAATSLQILILRNSRVSDLSAFRCLHNLLYIDMSDCRLSETAFEFLVDSPLVQYISVSNNLIYNVPDIHNPLLFELDMSFNLLSWLCRLQILNLKDNQITDVQPMSMCPFLRVLNLENNKIHDIGSIYSITMCQRLRELNLSGNPVETSPLFYKSIGTMFPGLQLLNGTPVCRKSGDPEKRVYIYGSPLKAARLCQDCSEHLRFYAHDEADHDEEVSLFKEWDAYATAKDESFLSYMGSYRAPYLGYLTAPHTQYSRDPLVRIQTQERRLMWLTNLLKQIETAIMPWLDKLKSDIYVYRVIYIQSLWRMRCARRMTHKQILLVRVCQRMIKRWVACKAAKQKLEELRKKRLDDAATIIQKQFRDFNIDEDIDWINKTNVNQFDDKMNDYLASEELMHFEAPPAPPTEPVSAEPDEPKKGVAEHATTPVPQATSSRQSPTNKGKRRPRPSSRLGQQREELIKKISNQACHHILYNALAHAIHAAPLQHDIARTILQLEVAGGHSTTQQPHVPERFHAPERSRASFHGEDGDTGGGAAGDGLSSSVPQILVELPEDAAVAMYTATEDSMSLATGLRTPAFDERVRGALSTGMGFSSADGDDDEDRFAERDMQTRKFNSRGKDAFVSRAESTSTDCDPSELEQQLGWTGYGTVTRALLEKKRKRMQRLEMQPLERERLKDPMRRYQLFKAQAQSEQERSLEEPTRTERSRLRLKDAPVIYEWDIHAGETAQKLTGVKESPDAKHPPSQLQDIKVLGPGAAVLKPSKPETARTITPQVTLLINNYVANKALEGPETRQPIHRWLKNDIENMISVRSIEWPQASGIGATSLPQPLLPHEYLAAGITGVGGKVGGSGLVRDSPLARGLPGITADGYRSGFKPRYPTDIGKVVSKVQMPPPQYGSYELYRHPPLPAIAHPADGGPCDAPLRLEDPQRN
nr:hypothetical protein HK105_001719 [Polyrhizophydium stewartii]